MKPAATRYNRCEIPGEGSNRPLEFCKENGLTLLELLESSARPGSQKGADSERKSPAKGTLWRKVADDKVKNSSFYLGGQVGDC